MKPLLVSSGEPAGIGPDICLALTQTNIPIVVMSDMDVLRKRAEVLRLPVVLEVYDPDKPFLKSNTLQVLPITCKTAVEIGKPNPVNAPYVLEMLATATQLCLNKQFSALVTAPVSKAVIHESGVAFSGHTEFLAQYCNIKTVVMMLACPVMRVAMATTHIPLQCVPSAITQQSLIDVVLLLNTGLKQYFGIKKPKIYVAALNPHGGESGYIGREEIDVIIPAIQQLQEYNFDIQGPYPADTLFTSENLQEADVFLVMYHDQGLPVLKYACFDQGVNITFGLPIIRTSVDHGTAFSLAGTGRAEPSSLFAAITTAAKMATQCSLV